MVPRHPGWLALWGKLWMDTGDEAPLPRPSTAGGLKPNDGQNPLLLLQGRRWAKSWSGLYAEGNGFANRYHDTFLRLLLFKLTLASF